MGEWIQSQQSPCINFLGEITVVTSSTNNTFGNYIELIASTSYDYSGIILTPKISYIRDWILQVAIGPAGSEKDISGYIRLGVGGNTVAYLFVYQIKLDVSIPAGTRISAKGQGVNSSTVQNIFLTAHGIRRGDFSKDFSAPKYEGYAGLADSGLVSIDPGGTADTKGGWSVLVESTSYNSCGFYVQFGGQSQDTRTTCNWAVDIGIGATGSEVVIIQDIYAAGRTEHDAVYPFYSHFFPISIPLGTKISARAACTLNTATVRLIDVEVILKKS